MNPDTGEIRQFPSDKEAKAAGFTVPIPEAEREGVAALNRAQRRAWAKEHRLPMLAATVANLQYAQREAHKADAAKKG